MATAAPGAYVGTGADAGSGRAHGTDRRPIASGDNPQQLNNPTARFSPYFGENPKPYLLSPYDQYGRENFALPEAYLGYSPFMTNVMITLITNEDMWPTTVLPYRETQDTSTIQWNEYHFNRHLLGPVPEEGVSRLVSQQMNERRDHYTRYGLAMILEHGFMNTEKGRMCYINNLQQIRNAVLETVYLGVLESLLRCKSYDDMWNERFGGVRSSAAARKALMMEIEDFATIQKTEHGWDLLDSRCKRYLRSKDVQPDTWIIPEGMKPYITQVRRENYTYMLAGPEGPQNFKSGLNGGPANVVDGRNDCKIFETKSFEMPEMSEPIDVTRRNRAIGEFFIMQEDEEAAHYRAKYVSSQRNIVIYDEDVDNFVEIRLIDAIQSDPLLDKSMYEVVADKEICSGSTGDGHFYQSNHARYLHVPVSELHSRVHDVEFGDIPRQEETEANVSRGPPMSDNTLMLFADTYFEEGDRSGFVESFGRSAPQYLIDMDNDVTKIGSESFQANAKDLFARIRELQLRVDVTSIKDIHSKDLISQKVRECFAKKEDAYAFWMLCHGIASEESYFSPSQEVDEDLHRVYRNQLIRHDEDQELLPLPPQLTVQSFQQTCTAVFVTVIRATLTNDTELQQFQPIVAHVERLCADLCGLWFENSKDATYGSPNIDMYCSVMGTRRCVSSLIDNVSVSDIVYKTFEVSLFLTRALFQYMSTSQYIRRGEPCDCKPVGFNTLQGTRSLAKANENRIYQSDKCDKTIQMYLHLHRNVKQVFKDNTLTLKEDDLFNVCVVRHQQPGNVHVDHRKLYEGADSTSSGLMFLHKNEFQAYVTVQENYTQHMVDVSMDNSIEYSVNQVGTTFFQRLVGNIEEYTFDSDISQEDALDTLRTSLSPQTANQHIQRTELMDLLQNNFGVTQKEIEDCLTHLMGTEHEEAIKRALVTLMWIKCRHDTQAGNQMVSLVAKIALAYILKWAYVQVGLCQPHNAALQYYRTACTLMDLINTDSTLQSITSWSALVQYTLTNSPNSHLCLYDGDAERGGSMLSLGDGIVHFRVTPTAQAGVLKLGYKAGKIRTAFKAPKGLPCEGLFTRNTHPTGHHVEVMPMFVLYLKSLRIYDPNKSGDSIFDEWCSGASTDGPEAPPDRGIMTGLAGSSRQAMMPDASTAALPNLAVSSRKFDRTMSAFRSLGSKPHSLLVYILFCTQRLDREFLVSLVKNDILFPFGYLLLRPYQTYEMCTAILTKSGVETGETLIGHYDFQLSDNVIQKMHYGNFTIYEKSIVYRPTNVHLAEDIFCANYISGGGSEFFCNRDRREDAHVNDDRAPSLYPCLIGFDERIKDNPISVTGTFEPHTCLQSAREPHYSTAETYREIYEFFPMNAPSGDLPYFETSTRGNTMCFQGHQASYNHNTGHLDRVCLNTGHWGERVYPGCGKVRRGLSKYLEPVSYNNMRRGGGGAVTTGFGMMV
ncbi:hypothetical protein CYMTET_31808 [Cymbomonas tetramitiformis]|uniref:Uncharacterized protein n=1 Tax=Cymbomonas tetramitiformis TaxID=36881 RepID=A0AAE0FG91_9CHLO|nr:hypothetical protein CYMTET_31808 [Cymbomonas tetramitiformis]